jgi:competence protein ComEC
MVLELKVEGGIKGNAVSELAKGEEVEDYRDDVFRALFTGDLEMQGEKLLLEEYQNVQMQEASGTFEHSDEAGRKECLEFEQDECLEPEQDERLELEQDEFVENGKYEILEDSRYEVLKVGHHGSSSSSSAEFLEWALPRIALISCARNNSYGHPHKETMDCLKGIGSVICNTAEGGAIMVELDKNKEVKYWANSY